MVSPHEAAATAAEIVAMQPDFPLGLTQRVAAATLEAPHQNSKASPIRVRQQLSWIIPRPMVRIL
jgi:hypothetical protein